MRKQQKGFTLLELLISISLLAMLMASVAAAVHASLQSSTENTKLAALTQSARSVLNRITHDVRTAAAVDVTSTAVTIIPPAGSGMDQIQYEFADGVLYYRRTVSGSQESFVLIGSADENVTVGSFLVLSEIGLDWQGVSCTKSVTVTLGLTSGSNTLTVTASASPRRNQTF